MRCVGETTVGVVFKSCFPQNSFIDEDCAVRAVVIVNRRSLSGFPAEHQHLDKLVSHHPMTRVISGFEAKVRLYFLRRNFGALNQSVKLGERRYLGLSTQRFRQILERPTSGRIRNRIALLKLSWHLISLQNDSGPASN